MSQSYESVKENLNRQYQKRKKQKFIQSVIDILKKNHVEIDLKVIESFYDVIDITNRRMSDVVEAIIYLYVKYVEPLSMKITDLKVNLELVDKFQKEIADKQLIDTRQETIIYNMFSKFIDFYFPDEEPETLMEDSMDLYQLLKNNGLIGANSDRVIASSIIYNQIDTIEKSINLSELARFFTVSTISVRSFNRKIEKMKKSID